MRAALFFVAAGAAAAKAVARTDELPARRYYFLELRTNVEIDIED